LAAVQTVHDAAESGSKLSTDEIRVARQTGEKLLDVVLQAQAGLPDGCAAA
jgi:hypothetical protein